MNVMSSYYGSHRERGQVIPIFGAMILATFLLFTAIIDYGALVTMKIRAQTYADAAAEAAVSIQAQDWNTDTIILTAGKIEEYRLRSLLNGLQLATNSNGGCNLLNACAADFATLEAAYNKSVNRYTNLAVLLQQATAGRTVQSEIDDASALINQMTSGANCGGAHGLDCAFHYYANGTAYGAIGADSNAGRYNYQEGPACFLNGFVGTLFTPPSQCNAFGTKSGGGSSLAWTGPCIDATTCPPLPNGALWQPIRAEITTCAQVIFPITFSFLSPPRVIAHSAYVNGVVNSENAPPMFTAEQYVSNGNMYDWYDPSWSRTNAMPPAFTAPQNYFNIARAWWDPVPAKALIATPESVNGC